MNNDTYSTKAFLARGLKTKISASFIINRDLNDPILIKTTIDPFPTEINEFILAKINAEKLKILPKKQITSVISYLPEGDNEIHPAIIEEIRKPLIKYLKAAFDNPLLYTSELGEKVFPRSADTRSKKKKQLENENYINVVQLKIPGKKGPVNTRVLLTGKGMKAIKKTTTETNARAGGALHKFMSFYVCQFLKEIEQKPYKKEYESHDVVTDDLIYEIVASDNWADQKKHFEKAGELEKQIIFVVPNDGIKIPLDKYLKRNLPKSDLPKLKYKYFSYFFEALRRLHGIN